jgi:hypothetical protein
MLAKAIRNLTLVVLLVGLAACGQPQPSGTPQRSGGPGWTLLRTISPVDQGLGIAYESVGADAYEIQLTIFDKGGDGCATPTFTGFETEGTVFVATFERSPTRGAVCLVTAHIRFDVLLDRKSIPRSVNRLEMTETCEFAGCKGRGIFFQP